MDTTVEVEKGVKIPRRLESFLEAVYIEMDKLKFYLPEELLYKMNNPDLEFMIHISVVVLVIVMVSVLMAWKMGKKVKEKIPDNIKKRVIAAKEFVVPSSGPRFRKRDKVAFMGQKMVKRVKAAGSYIRGGQGRKRRAIAKFAKRFLGQEGSPEIIGQNFRLNLPLEYLEEEDYEAGSGIMPEQLRFVLQNMRVFGHFEHPIFLELVKQIEYMTVSTNQYLFKVGDPDENIFIVQSGLVNVYATDGDGSSILKHVKPGDAIMSLLSFLDHLAGHNKPYKTVSARATEDSKIIKVPFGAFKIAFEKYPDSYLRVVQIVMIRLQRVTLLALHQYLGLGAELIAAQHRGDKNMKYTDDMEDIMTTSQEQESLQPMQTPPTPSALQLTMNLESYAELRNTSQLRRKGSLVKREKMMLFALKSFKEQLKLESEASLEGNVEIRDIPAGFRIMEEDSLKDAALVLVIEGCFSVSQKNEEGKEQEIHLCYTGGLLGQLQVLTGEPSIFTVQAKVNSKVACLSRQVVFDMMSVQPDVTLQLANSVTEHMSSYVRSIDFALDWVLIESGKALYRQGDEAESTYVVLSGRLRAVVQRDGRKEMVAEYGRGELCGIVETLTGAKRSTTLLAVRDTEIAKIPGGLINSIKLKYPIVVSRLINLLGKRLLSLQQPNLQQPGPPGAVSEGSTAPGYSTVAVIAVTPGVPLSAITQELVYSLASIGPAICITPEVVRAALGPNALDPGNDFKLTAWLGAQEDHYKTVVYQCDGINQLTSWTQQCVRHADVVLVFADAEESPQVSPFEEKLETLSLRVTKELVLCHTENTEIPSGTAKWLENRPWISHHYHIKLDNRMYTKRSLRKLSEHYARLMEEKVKPDVHSDFSRLARMIRGTSVGLVLGGGGARGCSHVGMIKAVLEAGIPIDRVAGVSIGAFMGGLWCQERDVTKVTVKARSFSVKMAQKWRMAIDLTYPYCSLMTGFGFNGVIEEAFKETNIEDLWLPYFTITTDISVSCMKIHESGCLWRYVRASMSLAGYMPPLCDPADGHLLLDGGYTNNLPADIMHKRGAKHILAVDVGALDDVDLHNYGDWLSGWSILWAKLNPFATMPRVLSQADVQVRLAYVSCVRQLEEVKSAEYCDYIRPPIDKYGTLQFDAFDEIRDVGYYHGQTYFAGLRKAGQLWFVSNESTDRRGSLENLKVESSSTRAVGSYARFTDLAEMVCRVRQTTPDRANLPELDSPQMSDSDPDDSDIISDPEDYLEEAESGFISHTGPDDLLLQNIGIYSNRQETVKSRSRPASNTSKSLVASPSMASMGSVLHKPSIGQDIQRTGGNKSAPE